MTSLRLKSVLFLAGVLLCAPAALFAQQQQQQPGTLGGNRGTTVTVRLILQRAGMELRMVRVRLMTPVGIPVVENFTSSGTVDFPSISAGNYYVLVSGEDIQDTQSETFYIRPGVVYHMVAVPVEAAAQAENKPGGVIAAQEYSIPANARKEFDRALRALEKNRVPEARAHLRKAIQIHPAYGAAYNNLGVLAMREGNREEARQMFERAVEHAPYMAESFMNLAKVTYAEADYPLTNSLLASALQLQPQNVAAHYMLASSHFKLQAYDDALSAARKVHASPHAGLEQAHLLAAQILEAQGDLTAALDEYRQYLVEDPGGKAAPQVHTAVADLERRLATARQ